MDENQIINSENEDSLESLEKLKLRAEIKNLSRRPFNTPAFWSPVITLVLALTTYSWLFQSGAFDFKQAHIQYVTDTLSKRSKILDSLTNIKQDSLLNLRSEIESLSKKIAEQHNDSIRLSKLLTIYDSILVAKTRSMTDQQKQLAKLTSENTILIGKVELSRNEILGLQEKCKKLESEKYLFGMHINWFMGEWEKVKESFIKEQSIKKEVEILIPAIEVLSSKPYSN